MLTGVVQSGTGTQAAIPGVVVAGKTGTTTNYGDAWFVGWTPDLTVAVWVGFPSKLVSMGTLYNGQPVEGGTFPAIIWHTFMLQAIQILAQEAAASKNGQTTTTGISTTALPSAPTSTVTPGVTSTTGGPATTTTPSPTPKQTTPSRAATPAPTAGNTGGNTGGQTGTAGGTGAGTQGGTTGSTGGTGGNTGGTGLGTK
jgi:penicillin-binding protein 1A